MFKLFRKMWLACTGWMFTKASILDGNVNVAKASFENARKKKSERIRTITAAVGALMATKKAKVDEIAALEKECGDLDTALRGAERMGNQRGMALKAEGKTKEQILVDPEYIRCRTGYQDIESTLAEKRKRIKSLESSLNENSKIIADHQSQLQHLKSDLERLQEE